MPKGKPLTAAFVRNINTKGKYFDNSRKGLFLRVDEELNKTWVQRVTIGTRRREIGLGKPPVVTLKMARDRAVANSQAIEEGRDPIEEKHRDRPDATFARVTDKYLETKEAEFRNEKHRKQWRATLDTYAIPVIGERNVSQIGISDVLKVLEPIWETKTETASRLRARIEKILSWATVAELRMGDNPARWQGNLSEILPKPSKITTVRHFAALAQSDLNRWWADLSKRDGMSIAALRFAALAACRSGEVRGMTWDEVDLEAKNWTIPAKRMKARRLHRVPLTPNMLEILESVPRLEGSPYVFFSTKGGQLSDMALSSVMRKMHEADQKAGGPGYLDPKIGRPAVPHGLRSTFRDWAAETDQDHVLAELALAHDVGSAVHRAYRRTDMLEKRRKMMQEWGNFLIGK